MSKTDDVIAGLEAARTALSNPYSIAHSNVNNAITHILEQDARIKAMEEAIVRALDLGVDEGVYDLLAPFLPKPDPLVEAISAAWPNAAERFGEGVAKSCADKLRQALADRGLAIVEKEPQP